MIPTDDLRPGRIYAVEFRDCCVAGGFTAELLRIERLSYPDTTKFKTDDGTPCRLVFGNGVTLTEWGQVSFEYGSVE